MATEKQVLANRQNAKGSTGPRTERGKNRSRRNAIRHGLLAETILDLHENPAIYKALQKAIFADYHPQTNFELELIGRLVSLLWRLRRAVAIESGLLNINTENSRDRNQAASSTNRLSIFYNLIPSHMSDGQTGRDQTANQPTEHVIPRSELHPPPPRSNMARSFRRLIRLDEKAFERLGRYEMNLWRQATQIILLLNSINRDGTAQFYDEKRLRFKTCPPRMRRHTLWPPFMPPD
jgi:hypothetical protein